MADKRQLNRVWWAQNRLGAFFVFGKVGSGKDSYTVTLAQRKTRKAIMEAERKFQRYIGLPMKDVPRER